VRRKRLSRGEEISIVKLIAMDLDGTLLDKEGRIPERNREALREAASRGVVVALASGRMTDCIAPFARELGLDCPIIAYNGGMVRLSERDRRERIFHRPLEAALGREIVEFCRGRYQLNFYLDDRLYAEDSSALRPWAELYSRQTGARYIFLPSLEPLASSDPTKLILITTPAERDRLHDEWVERLAGKATIVKTNPEYLEFLNLRADKGVALLALAKRLGIEPADVMALGDGDNDAPMLRAAGLGVAMANATPLAKAAAREVSRLAHHECAVAEAIERHVLGQ